MKSKIFIFLLIVLLTNMLQAQNNIGQIWSCNTRTESQSLSNQKSMTVLVPVTLSPKVVNIFVHILRMDNGTGGLSTTQVNDWLALLVNDYLPNNIFFQVIGQANLNNSQYYINGITDLTFNSLINTNTHPNAIDIYLLSPNDTYSRASGIPGIALAVGGQYAGTSVLSHELGHCLGLYHTHSGNGCNDLLNCSENINGSNCLSCGDLICDTPADPCLSGNVNTNCVYIGGGGFNPDVHNIMSYAPPTCLNHITIGQKERIHWSILNNSIFLTRVMLPSISGSDLICLQSTYSILSLPSGATVQWSVSNTNIASINSNTGELSRNNYGNGNEEIYAIIKLQNNSYLPALIKSVWVGTPTISLSNISNLQDMGYSNYYKILPASGFYAYEGTLTVDVPPLSLLTDSTWSYYSGMPGRKVAYWSASGFTVDAGAKTTNAGEVIKYTVTNTCGQAYNLFTFFTGDMIPPPPPLIITPNPSSTEAEVRIDEVSIFETVASSQATNSKTSNAYNLTVLNSSGVSVYSASSSNNKIVVPTSTIKNGIYIVRVTDGIYIYQGNLIVNH